MKLPGHLLRTYRKYKREEADVLDWIFTTAEKIGFKAKQTTKLSLFDIVCPVRALAKSPNITSVPPDIVTKLQACLYLRQKCAYWYKTNTNQNDRATREKNDKHQYPIKILQEVIHLLKRKMVINTTLIANKASTTTLKTRVQPQTTANKFATLESSESDDPAADDNATKPLQQDPISSVAEDLVRLTLSDDDRLQTEYNLAQFCMRADIQEIEDYIVLELVRFATDGGNAKVVAYLLDLAIDLVVEMENQTYKDMVDPGVRGANYAELFSDKEKGLAGLASPLMRFQAAIAIQARISNGKKGRYSQELNFGDRDVQNMVQKLSPMQVLNYVAMDWRAQFPVEFSYVSYLWASHSKEWVETVSPFWSNSMVKCMHWMKFDVTHYRETHFQMVPLSCAFALRLALLASSICREGSSSEFTKLLHIATTMAVEAPQWQELGQAMICRAQHPVIVNAFRTLSEDMISTRKLTERKTLQAALKVHPTLATLNNTTAQMYRAFLSLAVIDRTFVVGVLAHLFNYLKEQELLFRDWPAIKTLVDIVGEDAIYQGKPPTARSHTRDAMKARLWYVLGHKPKDGMHMARTLMRGNDTDSGKIRLTWHPRLSESGWPLYHGIGMRMVQDM